MAATKKEVKESISHVLIPSHVKISEKEKEELFKRYNITTRELPKIDRNDPAIAHLDVKENDVIRIDRKSPTAGTSVFYRGVINEQ
jgi:DNA-directed RNA polymerase subunit H (RpoH/RPB5)